MTIALLLGFISVQLANCSAAENHCDVKEFLAEIGPKLHPYLSGVAPKTGGKELPKDWSRLTTHYMSLWLRSADKTTLISVYNVLTAGQQSRGSQPSVLQTQLLGVKPESDPGNLGEWKAKAETAVATMSEDQVKSMLQDLCAGWKQSSPQIGNMSKRRQVRMAIPVVIPVTTTTEQPGPSTTSAAPPLGPPTTSAAPPSGPPATSAAPPIGPPATSAAPPLDTTISLSTVPQTTTTVPPPTTTTVTTNSKDQHHDDQFNHPMNSFLEQKNHKEEHNSKDQHHDDRFDYNYPMNSFLERIRKITITMINSFLEQTNHKDEHNSKDQHHDDLRSAKH